MNKYIIISVINGRIENMLEEKKQRYLAIVILLILAVLVTVSA